MREITIKRLLPTAVLMLSASLWPCLPRAETIGFEDVGAGLSSQSFWNGADGSGGFSSGSLAFNNSFNTQFGSWSGWSYSNTTDTTTAGFTNQYSAFAGSGAAGSATYAMANNFSQGDAQITIPDGFFISSAMITNGTFAALSMLQGDAFAKKFGGSSGNDPDWFLLRVFGKAGNGQTIGFEEFYLADYRFTDNSNDFIVNTWTPLDLSSLRGARTLEFSLASSDVGAFGLNTPAYFAIDNLVVSAVPEPSTIAMLLGGISLLLVGRWQHRTRKVGFLCLRNS